MDINAIQNPILKGFNPDPSIVRVGDDYYIATSTFQWFPGVQIHHSKDLKNWELVARPLSRKSQLDMSGVPDSGGVWAPCLSYNDGVFYLVYTNVKTADRSYIDSHNYLVTATDIRGEWSDPIYLNSDGFDPSLFHDGNRKWLVNMIWDVSKAQGKPAGDFGGIRLQEYSVKEKKLVGKPKIIFKGTNLRATEAPHLYKLNGYYYLLTAEGGTNWNHSVTIARSKTIDGPYEVDPQNPMLTSRPYPTLQLQRAGHADLVETQNGEWYMVHLAGRPTHTKGRCILGRETCIQKVYWTEDKWLRLTNGTNKPDLIVSAPNLPEHPFNNKPSRDNFENKTLDINFQTLRLPAEDLGVSLIDRPGYLRLRGMESLCSKFNQALVARRLTSMCCSAETRVEFEPETTKHMAGLVCYYDTRNFYYLHITHNDELGKVLSIFGLVNRERVYFNEPISIPSGKGCKLKATMYYDTLTFSYCIDGEEWQSIDRTFDLGTLSDEACRMSGTFGCHTGTFVGLCCQDLFGTGKYSDFEYFEYVENDD